MFALMHWRIWWLHGCNVVHILSVVNLFSIIYFENPISNIPFIRNHTKSVSLILSLSVSLFLRLDFAYERRRSETKRLPNIQFLRTGQIVYSCPRCNKMLGSNYYRHMRECGEEPMYKCSMCEHRSKRMDNLRLHMRRKHMLWTHTLLFTRLNISYDIWKHNKTTSQNCNDCETAGQSLKYTKRKETRKLTNSKYYSQWSFPVLVSDHRYSNSFSIINFLCKI